MRAHEIELLLPEVMRRTVVPGSPMAAIVAAMEGMHAPAEAAVASFPDVLNPLRTPDRFVPMLAEWLDLDRLDRTTAGRIELDRLRLLVSLAPVLARYRGTAGGLLWVLSLATGVRGLTLVDVGPFHIQVVVPTAGASALALLREIAQQEKPAHLVVDVVVAQDPATAPS